MTFVFTFFREDFILMFSDSWGRLNGVYRNIDKTFIYSKEDFKMFFHFYGDLQFTNNWDYEEFKQELKDKLNSIPTIGKEDIRISLGRLQNWLNCNYHFSPEETDNESKRIMGFHLSSKYDGRLVVYDVSNLISNAAQGRIILDRFENHNINLQDSMKWMGIYPQFSKMFYEEIDYIKKELSSYSHYSINHKILAIRKFFGKYIREYVNKMQLQGYIVSTPLNCIQIQLTANSVQYEPFQID